MGCHVLTFLVILCHFCVIFCHFVSFVVICCHFVVIFCHFVSFFVFFCLFVVIFCYFVSFVVIVCHCLSFVVIVLSVVVICCHFLSFLVVFLSFFVIFCHFCCHFLSFCVQNMAYDAQKNGKKCANDGKMRKCRATAAPSEGKQNWWFRRPRGKGNGVPRHPVQTLLVRKCMPIGGGAKSILN